MSLVRQKVAKRIERLVKNRALSEDQLLHLFYIFSIEDEVKITCNQTRRLLRVERYSDDTIKKVINFLDVIESQVSAEGPDTMKRKNKRIPTKKMPERPQQPIPAKRRVIVKPALQPVVVETLPRLLPSQDPLEARYESRQQEAGILSDWLTEQTKRGRQAKKIDPQICCPEMLSVLPTSVRQLPQKKKRKRTAKKKKSKLKEEIMSEESELVYEEEEEVSVEIFNEEIAVDGVDDIADDEEEDQIGDEGGDEEDDDEELENEEDGDDDEMDDDDEVSVHSIIGEDVDDDDDADE